MNTVTPKIICFDLGGVVVRICRSWGQACARAGIAERDPELFGRPDLSRRRKELVEQYQTGRIACGEFFPSIAAATGGLYSPEEVRRIHDAWIIADYPGIGALIDRLNAAPGVVTACLSNTNHAHWIGMMGEGPGWSSAPVRALKIKGASQKIGASKPGLEIYKRAEGLLGARGGEIVFFDDLQENIDAANSMGWRGVRIDHEGDPAAQALASLRALGVGV